MQTPMPIYSYMCDFLYFILCLQDIRFIEYLVIVQPWWRSGKCSSPFKVTDWSPWIGECMKLRFCLWNFCLMITENCICKHLLFIEQTVYMFVQRLCSFVYQQLLDEQLSTKQGLYLASFGTDVQPLWTSGMPRTVNLALYVGIHIVSVFPMQSLLMLWCCWLGDRKCIWPREKSLHWSTPKRFFFEDLLGDTA